MKKADIPARKAVAYKARKYSNIEPAYVLDTKHLWTYSRLWGNGQPRKWATSTETRFKSTRGRFYTDRHGDDGFLTIVIHAGRSAPAERDAKMREIESLIDELPTPLLADDVRELDEKMPSGVWLGVVNNVCLVGEWLPVLEAQAAERKAENEQREAELVQHKRFQTLVGAIVVAAAERGYDTWRLRTETEERMSLPASMLADLLGIEPETKE